MGELLCSIEEQRKPSIDAERNASAGPIISAETSSIAVLVVPTDEEGAIARHVAAVVGGDA